MKIDGKFFLASAFTFTGSAVVAISYVGSLGPFTITGMSLIVSLATALLLSGKEMGRTARKMSGAQWRFMLLQAFFGVFLFRVFLSLGLARTSAAEGGILTGTTPALTALLTWVFLREFLNKRKIVGVLLTMLGIMILQGFPFNLQAFNINHLLGNFMVLCAAGCEAVFGMLSRLLHRNSGAGGTHQPLSPVVHAGIISLVALAFCIIPMFLEAPLEPLLALPVSGWLALFWYGIFISVLAMTLIFKGAETCDGYAIAAFTGVIPVSALILSIIILNEPVSLHHWLGCVCIIAAILLMSQRPKSGQPQTGS